MTVSVYTTYISPTDYDWLVDDFNYELTVRHLLHEDQAKLSSIKDRRIKAKKLVTSLFVVAVLNYVKHGKLLLDPVTFTYNKYGKPSIEGVSFNVSTSNDVIALAVDRTGGPIGIDLSHSSQRILRSSFLGDFKDIFHILELQQLESIKEESVRYAVFNQFWTLKEAFTKYTGSGLNMDLQLFYFRLGGHVDGQKNTDFMQIKKRGDFRSPVVEYKVDWIDHTVISQENDLFCRSGTLIPGDPPVVISIVKLGPIVCKQYYVTIESLIN